MNRPHPNRQGLAAVPQTRFFEAKRRAEARNPAVQAVAHPGTRPTETGFTLIELLAVARHYFDFGRHLAVLYVARSHAGK